MIKAFKGELSNDKTPFVNLKEIIPDIKVELRYLTDYNFVGEKIDGYEKNIAYVTKECAKALKKVEDEVKNKGYTIKIYDAYRPKMAVEHFIRWAKSQDLKTKDIYYRGLDKKELFRKGYIAKTSSHTRGSTVDLTLCSLKDETELDTGGEFDQFGSLAHYKTNIITQKQKDNRKYLRDIMTKHGFIPIENEWWHFTLKDEPYPNTYFNFTIK